MDFDCEKEKKSTFANIKTNFLTYILKFIEHMCIIIKDKWELFIIIIWDYWSISIFTKEKVIFF